MKRENRATNDRETAITGYARGKAAAQHSLDNSNAVLGRCWAVDHLSGVELVGIPTLPKHGWSCLLHVRCQYSSMYCSPTLAALVQLDTKSPF
jgi:hypothetical protein